MALFHSSCSFRLPPTSRFSEEEEVSPEETGPCHKGIKENFGGVRETGGLGLASQQHPPCIIWDPEEPLTCVRTFMAFSMLAAKLEH